MTVLLKTLEKRSNNYLLDLERLSKLKVVDHKDEDKDIISSLDLIKNLGFTNSVNAKMKDSISDNAKKFNEAISAACRSIKLISEVRSYFGKSALIIKLDDFINIVKKYKLVCGNFNNYTNIIPDKNALEIEDARYKINHLEECKEKFPQLYKCYYKYRTVLLEEFRMKSGYILRRYERNTLNIFPVTVYSTNCCYYKSDIESNICAFLNTYRNTDLKYQWINRIKYKDVPNSLFICAPKNQMNNSERKIKFSILPPPTEDPLICTLTPDGSVIIISMWGKEAEDSMLDKYKKLFPDL